MVYGLYTRLAKVNSSVQVSALQQYVVVLTQFSSTRVVFLIIASDGLFRGGCKDMNIYKEQW